MSHARISGWLLVATGVLHTVLGLVRGRADLVAMLNEGLWRTALVSGERQQVVWFLMAGGMFLLSGLLALKFDRELPRSFGWMLAFIAVLGALVFGPSGFFLVIPQAIYILMVPRGTEERSARGALPTGRSVLLPPDQPS